MPTAAVCLLLVVSFATPARAASVRAEGTVQAALPVAPSVHGGPVLRLGYNVYLGGLNVFAFTTDVAIAGKTYSIKGSGKSRGVIRLFWRWAVNLTAQGTVGPEGVRAQIYNVDTFRKRRNRSLQLSFDEGGRYAIQRTPPDTPHRAAKREPPDHLPPGVIDPLSVAMLIGQSVGDGKGCDTKLPIFDGDRRYDLTFTDLGNQTVMPTPYSVYAGPARRCRFEMKEISGFRESHIFVSYWDGDALDPPEIWVAQIVPQIPPVPVRIQGDFSMGGLIIYLVSAEFAGKPLFAPKPKRLREVQTRKK